MQSQAFHTGRSPVPPLPPTLVRGTTLCLAALVSSAGDSLGVSRRKLPRHGPTRLHHDPAEAYMRPVLVNIPTGTGYRPAAIQGFQPIHDPGKISDHS